MREVFYEETVECGNEVSERKKYNTAKTISYISYVLFLVALIFGVNFFQVDTFSKGIVVIIITIIVHLLPAGAFLGCGIIFGKIKNKYCIEYDYSFVSGSVRFAKVINNKRRIFILDFDTSSIEKIGRYGSNTFNKYSANTEMEKIKLTSNKSPLDGKEFFYIVINDYDSKKILLLECTETFIVHILKYSNKTIFEKD